MTIGTSYAAFFPQGLCTNLVCDNIDVFKAESFYKSDLVLSTAREQSITITNVHATDALRLGYFVRYKDQNSGVKTVAFENISLPKTVTYLYISQDSGNTSNATSNFSFTFNNVWYGDTQFTESDITNDETVATVTFGEEYDADKAGGQICGNPNALANALEKIEYYSLHGPTLANSTTSTAHMCIINPLAGSKQTFINLFSTHPPTQERIARLRQQAMAMGK